MAAVETAISRPSSAPVALPGLGRVPVLAGRLEQKSAQDIYRGATSNRTRVIAEFRGPGVVSTADLAHDTTPMTNAAPLINFDAVDAQRLPRGLFDGDFCRCIRAAVLGKRNILRDGWALENAARARAERVRGLRKVKTGLTSLEEEVIAVTNE